MNLIRKINFLINFFFLLKNENRIHFKLQISLQFLINTLLSSFKGAHPSLSIPTVAGVQITVLSGEKQVS